MSAPAAISLPAAPVPGPVAAEPGARDPRWARPALIALLAATAVCWLVGLSRNGWANAFYSAAVQAGTRSWKAALFGSFDAGNSITVDKPPAALWPMELSARVFGVNSWSFLVPQVLLGVASVALLYVVVKKPFGPVAGLLAGLLLAVTPVATLMFRYNNPDALLMFVMIAAAWALLRALGDGRTRWLLLCGALLGLGFLTKQLQVMLVVPALALTYLLAGPGRWPARSAQLLAGLAAMVVAAGWWVLLVSAVPAADRPYVGGSTDNSFLNLTVGYNGLSRLTGHRSGSSPVPSGQPGYPSTGHGFSFGSHAGPLRLFTGESAAQNLLAFARCADLRGGGPAVAAQGAAHRRPTRALRAVGRLAADRRRGTQRHVGDVSRLLHVVLAPAAAALVGAGVTELWARRRTTGTGLLSAAIAALTAVWSWTLLGRTPQFAPPLRGVILLAGLAAAVGLLIGLHRSRSRLAVAGAAVAAAAALAGPLAYSAQTVATAHTGGMVIAGPRITDNPTAAADHSPWVGQPSVTEAMTRLLAAAAGAYTWVAAANGANAAAGYQLATGDPVMPIGGFSARDPSPTLGQFQRDVADKHIHYYIESRRPDTTGAHGEGSSQQPPTATQADAIANWVKQMFTPMTVDGVTVYDLTTPRP